MDFSSEALSYPLGFLHVNSPFMFNPRRHDRIPMEFEDFNVSEKMQKFHK